MNADAERQRQIDAARKMERRPRVYVSQEINADFAKATRFGELVFMTLSGRDDFNAHQDGLNNGHLMNKIEAQLREFDEERDYIILTGSPYVNAAISLILGRRARWVRYLRWDNRFTHDYTVVGIPLTERVPQDTIQN